MKNELSEKSVRKPVQARSIVTKERILDAALNLFSEKGYYQTTTNEIAQRAGVSIGSLYSYFKDKDQVFLEVLDKYHEVFQSAKNRVMEDQALLKRDLQAWMKEMILCLIEVHEDSKALNRELHVLSFYNPRVAEILEENRRKTMRDTIGVLMTIKQPHQTDDTEAVATVLYDMISATVDRIVFSQNEIDRSRLIDATVDIIHRYYAFPSMGKPSGSSL